jgi:hypothetical protein
VFSFCGGLFLFAYRNWTGNGQQQYNKNMPELSRFLGMVISIYFDDHNPPHFHMLYNEHEVERCCRM